MKLVRPIEITDSNLISSNVAVSSTPIWDIGTAYTIGDVVRVDATHHEYEATADSTGVYPPDNVAPATIVWLDIGATNRWAMFDNVVGLGTLNTGAIEVSISGQLVNSVGLLNIKGSQINVNVVYESEVVYDKTIILVLENATDFYTYFFEPIIRQTDIVLTDLPTFNDAIINISIGEGVIESTGCGLCIIGNSRYLGDSQWGINADSVDYSVTDENQFGGLEIIQRAFSKRMEVDIFVPNLLIDEVYRLLNLYRATALLWVGSDFNSTIMYGYRKDFSIVLSGPAGSHCSLTIQGLI